LSFVAGAGLSVADILPPDEKAAARLPERRLLQIIRKINQFFS
jgi:hypothetical protein